jgi:hypothetical protein
VLDFLAHRFGKLARVLEEAFRGFVLGNVDAGLRPVIPVALFLMMVVTLHLVFKLAMQVEDRGAARLAGGPGGLPGLVVQEEADEQRADGEEGEEEGEEREEREEREEEEEDVLGLGGLEGVSADNAELIRAVHDMAEVKDE